MIELLWLLLRPEGLWRWAQRRGTKPIVEGKLEKKKFTAKNSAMVLYTYTHLRLELKPRPGLVAEANLKSPCREVSAYILGCSGRQIAVYVR